MKVYIQRHGNTFQFDGAYAAYEGADRRGMEVILFDDIMEVPARREVMVIGSIDNTKVFFQRLGMKIPNAINLPESIMPYIHRKIEYMTRDEFFERTVCPIFVKPAFEVKMGMGHSGSGVIKNESNKRLVMSDFKENIMLLTSEVVNMVSEYRVYVSKLHGILGMKHYQGDEFIYPDNSYIRSIVDILMNDETLPASFSVDFAVIEPENNFRYTEVIECQDAWSIGSYGLDGEVYFNFLLERWKQLMKK